jgi:hypothetical protein
MVLSGCVTYRELVTLGILLLVAGCGFQRVSGDDMGGDGGSSLMNMGGSSDDMAGSAACALPQLIITVADVSGNSALGGQLARVSLAGAAPSSCTTLTAQTALGADISVSTYFAPGVIATSDSNKVYLVDAERDQIISSVNAPTSGMSGYAPLEAFPMQDGAGKDFGAIAFGTLNPDSFIAVVGFDAKGGIVGNSPWCVSGTACGSSRDLMLGLQVLGMAANPVNPSHLLAVDNANNVAAVDVNPFAQTRTTLIPGNSTHLQKAYAVSANGKLRVAWVNATPAATPPTAVSFYNDIGAAGTKAVSGPLYCKSGCSDILRAVPDPTAGNAFFVLCEGPPGNGRSVVRLKTDGTCTPIFNGLTLPAAYQLRHLAVAQ